MRKLLVVCSLLIMLVFLVSCAPEAPLTDEELEAELAKLTPEEREQLLADLEAKDSGALAGKGYASAIAKTTYSKKVSPKVVKAITRASPAQVTQIRAAVTKVETVIKADVDLVKICKPKTGAELCILEQTCGDFSDGCGGVVQCGNLCGDLRPDCIMNRCVWPGNFCEDSDGGIDLLKRGDVTSRLTEDHSIQQDSDLCYRNLDKVNDCDGKECTVVEYSCAFGTQSFGSTYEYFPCPNGCKDGACLPS